VDPTGLIQGTCALGEKLPRRRRAEALRGQPLAVAAQERKTSWRGSQGGVLEVWTGKSLEKVDIDPVKGPKIYHPNGRFGYMVDVEHGQSWRELASSDQKVLVYRAAHQNQEVSAVLQEREARAAEEAWARAAREAEEAWERAAEESPQARRRLRCERERQREPVYWFPPITMDTVTQGHDKVAPGMFYGLPFPWSAEKLAEFGPEWLTQAFHACGSMSKSNRVTKITIDDLEITAGNNSSKFLFEVEYAEEAPGLHTKLFAKIPYPMTPATQNDRYSSSVNKQPMDFYEINTYRLMDAAFPMETPKFYYGDISRDTSNFILITERVLFAELDGLGKRPLEPFEIEGPYDKCKDYQLGGRDKEYYMLLMQVSGRIAGFHKAGKLGDEDFLAKSMAIAPLLPGLGLNPYGGTGSPPSDLSKKLEAAVQFFADTARVLYPDYVTGEAFQAKFKRAMMTRNAYHAEITYWKNSHNPDYVALGHQNLNADNAYFWRDADGNLDCGVYDWGGFGSSCLGHKIYWMFNCADFDQVQENLSDYMDAFITAYSESGGPTIEKDVLEAQILLTSMENMEFMVRSVPNSLRMCPKKEWATIKDRHDPRIAGNVDGKSTLRTTLHALNNGIRIMEEMKADEVLEKWVQDYYVGRLGQQPKAEAVIFS